MEPGSLQQLSQKPATFLMLREDNHVHALTIDFCKIHFNITLPTNTRNSSKWFLSLGFPPKHCIHLPFSSCAKGPSHHILLHLISRVRPKSLLGIQEVSENEILYKSVLTVHGSAMEWLSINMWVFDGRILLLKLGKEQLQTCVHYSFFKMWLLVIKWKHFIHGTKRTFSACEETE
jgi:hypothetical protein